jgi:hypothetical protein
VERYRSGELTSWTMKRFRRQLLRPCDRSDTSDRRSVRLVLDLQPSPLYIRTGQRLKAGYQLTHRCLLIQEWSP